MAEQPPAQVRHLHLAHPAAEVPLEARDDDALMALAAADHRGAFELLAARHLGLLAGYCAKFLGSRSAGEEVAQDVLVEAWTARRRYRAQGRLRVLLLTMARTRCLNHLRAEGRRQARAPALVEVPGTASVEAGPAGQLDGLLAQERGRQVRAALLTLPVQLREAVLLRYDRALDYAEIARVVGRPEATVRSRVFQALKRLRRALDVEVEP